MTTAVRDARPPIAVIRVLNPIMRTVLPTRLGRIVTPFALLEFSGRRSGRRYRVPAGWYEVDGGHIVVSPAPWRINFAGGAPATVFHRGRSQQLTGTLITDPATVADILQALFDAGTSAKQVGIALPKGHRISGADVVLVERAIIRFPCVEADAPPV